VGKYSLSSTCPLVIDGCRTVSRASRQERIAHAQGSRPRVQQQARVALRVRLFFHPLAHSSCSFIADRLTFSLFLANLGTTIVRHLTRPELSLSRSCRKPDNELLLLPQSLVSDLDNNRPGYRLPLYCVYVCWCLLAKVIGRSSLRKIVCPVMFSKLFSWRTQSSIVIFQ
jgi:hypothetical protein